MYRLCRVQVEFYHTKNSSTWLMIVHGSMRYTRGASVEQWCPCIMGLQAAIAHVQNTVLGML